MCANTQETKNLFEVTIDQLQDILKKIEWCFY